jgi:hypothetical protein
MGNINTLLLQIRRVFVLGLVVTVGLGGAGCANKSGTTTAEAPSNPEPVVTPAAAVAPVNPPATTPAKQPVLPPGVSKIPAPFEGAGWEDLFNGYDLSGWKVTPFAGRAEVGCISGLILLNMGDPFTGVSFTNPTPTMNYEIALDAMRVMGSDFFCGLTVPVGESHCSLIVGGWGGGLVGISSLDGMDASENETTKYESFESGRWYRVRLRVTKNRIEGWIDERKLIDVNTTDRKISLRPGDIELSKPLGIACWQSSAALREIKLRRVDGPADPPRKGR